MGRLPRGQVARTFRHAGVVAVTVRTVSELVTVATARTCRRAFRNRNAARRAVAVRGAVCYNMPRCAAMGSETPATKQRHNGTIKQFPNPVNGSMRPALCFARLRGLVSL